MDYDIAVIGAGSWGLTVAIGLARTGKRVALVERHKIGGDCTNYGCVPSKALLDIARSGKHTVISGLAAARARRQLIQDEETPEALELHGLSMKIGDAQFVDPHTLAISSWVGQSRKSTTSVTAAHIVLATGAHSRTVEIDGVNPSDVLSNTEIFEQTIELPHLIIIGGGYIGCELAEAFAGLGSNVTIVQRADRLIPWEEPESSRILEQSFVEKWITVLLGARINKGSDHSLHITQADGSPLSIKYTKILVAIGRDPNIQGLGLETIGINYQKGVIVNAYNQTNQSHIYAIWDCVEGNPQFTHLANNEGRGVIRNILFPLLKSKVRDAILPSVLYTNLEVARVGMTEKELVDTIGQEAFITHTLDFAHNDRSRITEDGNGFVMIHCMRITGHILWATIMGSHAGEMIASLAIAMQHRITAYGLSRTIFAYPTKSEIIKKVADKFVVGTLSNIRGETIYWIRKHAPQIIAGTLWISVITAFLLYKNIYNLSSLDIAKRLYLFLSQSYWWPFFYIFIYAIRPLVLFPATLLTFMSGALFGIYGGFIYTMIGENLSANIAYWMGRIFGKSILPAGSTGIIATFAARLENRSFIPVLMTRFLFFPFDLINYAAGILRVNWKWFLWGTAIGIIPGALVFIIAGASLENVASFDLSNIRVNKETLAISAAIFALALGFAKVISWWEKRNTKKGD
jgi:pyruvate/2-oxoglutarate dehydrogenase complex dihydrolipoamide dehydrogenase (E3) component/uncharacterized membrane protein YdjX (TVP38/TMEM64 family)